MQRTIDLSTDVGVGDGGWRSPDEAALMSIVTSANIACGFHGGDPTSIRHACGRAVEHGVAIGALVSYPDPMGSGQRFIDIEPDDLVAAVAYQIGALDALAHSVGGRVAFVRPHGALARALAHHEQQAAAVVDAVAALAGRLPILGLPNSVLERVAVARGVRFVLEGHADRAYDTDGHLVDHRRPDAVLADPATVADQARGLLAWRVESIHVHPDTPGAPTLLAAVREAVIAAGATLAPFHI